MLSRSGVASVVLMIEQYLGNPNLEQEKKQILQIEFTEEH